MKRLLIGLFSFCLLPAVWSQSAPGWTSADMYLGLRKLNVLGSVLYVAAHPDDENTRLITYLSKDKLYRTGYLSLTRGDGGQNLIGDEQGIELGLIRTQELLAARRIDGGEQFFSRAYDFGFSKNPEETFTKWDKEKILSDVVWMIRKFQPDVIITRFPTTGEGGHGHHTASAILANEAFAAAADAKRFPEQLKYVTTWQAKRILFNSFNFGGTNTTDDSQFKIDVGGYNPLLGKSYGEIAAESRSQHKSQGFGVPASRGESFESFKTTGGTAPVKDLMDGVTTSWQRVAGGEKIATIIDSLTTSFDLVHPEKSVEGLVRLYTAIYNLPEGYWKDRKLKEVYQLIAQCSGLFLEATTSQQFAVQTDSVRINFAFNNRLGADAQLQRVIVDKFDTIVVKTLGKNQNVFFSKTLYIPADKNITQPYWLANKMAEGYFVVNDQQYIGQPDVDPAYQAFIQVTIYGVKFTFVRPVKYKFTDPVKGELYEPLVILPPVEFDFAKENIFSINDKEADVAVHFKSNLNNAIDYPFSINYSDKWSTANNNFTYKTAASNMSNYVSSIFKPKEKGKNIKEVISLHVKRGDAVQYAGYKKSISYNHIPYINYFKEATANLEQVNINITGKKIGYIVGAGDKVPVALEQMGYEVTLLTEKELAKNNLAQFDAIISGVRAYNTNEWLNSYYEKLMSYVKEGGNLVVQYNTSTNIGPLKAKIGPYNFDISRTRVTDENATVNFVKPAHKVLNYPNKITADDFKGWIQERSTYHAANYDKAFETIFSMNDAGEKPDEGSLIIAPYGKGYFTYTGLVFFRELPAGVTGAYRLLANIIALNNKKAF